MIDFTPSTKLGEEGLKEDLAQYAFDPEAFVYAAYPWGEGQLRGHSGPDSWQKEILQEIALKVQENNFDGIHPVDPIKIKIQSGHGIGKSAMSAWLTNWICSTRPHCKGTVTASTLKQVKSKTWGEIRKWFNLSFTKHWFDVQAESLKHKEFVEWGASLQTSSEENSNSFAGQHAISSTSFYVLDESAAIPRIIWQMMMGGLTDGEPMVFAFGNPEINSGFFYDIDRGPERKYWLCREIDSRTVKITNRKEIDRWIDTYGLDSDFVRVRVLGKAPRSDSLQCISEDMVNKAVACSLSPESYMHASIILGADPAWRGSDPHVLMKRQGLQANTIGSWVHLPDETVGFTNKIAEAIKDHKSDAEFIDMHGIGGGVYDQLVSLNYEPILVNSNLRDNETSHGLLCANSRTRMWLDLRWWLAHGGSIPDDEELKRDLVAPHLFLVASGPNAGKYILETKKDMKKRGIASPGKAECLAYTFYQPVIRRSFHYDEMEFDSDMMHGYVKDIKNEEYDLLEYR